MAGSSDREKQSKVVQRGLDDQTGAIKSFDPTVKNRFDNYKLDFDYDTMDKNLDNVFDKTVAGINSDARTDVAQTKKGTLRSLSSRGITGGSVVDDTVSKTTNPIITNKANTIRDLGIAKLDKKTALMDLFNKYGIDITKGASNIDLANKGNEFNKISALSNLLGLNIDNLQNLDDTTWLDDLFAGIEAGSGFVESAAKMFAGVPPTSGGGASMAK